MHDPLVCRDISAGIISNAYRHKIRIPPIASTTIGGVVSPIYHPIGAGILSHHFIEDRGLALGINGAMGALGRSSYPVIIALLLGTTPLGIFPVEAISLLASIPMIMIVNVAARSIEKESRADLCA